MAWIILVALSLVAAFVVPELLQANQVVKQVVRAGFFVVAFLSVASTSWTTIGSDEVGLLSRIYFGSQLPPGRIIALPGEKGPQAEILGPGFHFRLLLNVLYRVDKQPIVEIHAGKYGQ